VSLTILVHFLALHLFRHLRRRHATIRAVSANAVKPNTRCQPLSHTGGDDIWPVASDGLAFGVYVVALQNVGNDVCLELVSHVAGVAVTSLLFLSSLPTPHLS